MTDMLRVLVPMDDSPSALRAMRHVIELAGRGLAVEVHLLNVQVPVRGSAAALIAQSALNDYHREEGMKVLAGARVLVEQAGLPMHLHVGVGNTGETRWPSRDGWAASRSSWACAGWAASRDAHGFGGTACHCRERRAGDVGARRMLEDASRRTRASSAVHCRAKRSNLHHIAHSDGECRACPRA